MNYSVAVIDKNCKCSACGKTIIKCRGCDMLFNENIQVYCTDIGHYEYDCYVEGVLPLG